MQTKPTSYWTFFCNPARWQIDVFLADGRDEDTYQITEWQQDWFGPGQLGVVRVGVDRRTKAQLGQRDRLEPGIYAIVQVLGEPKSQRADDPYWLDPPSEDSERLAVGIKYLKSLLRRPLLLSELQGEPAVTDKYLLDGFQSATMPLDPGTLERLLELAGGEASVIGNIASPPADTAQALAELERRYAGAAPQVKEAINRRIERGPVAAAVKEAIGFRCQVCLALGRNPISFVKKDGEPFVEAHHVTFVTSLEPGSLGPSNIITVCPNHHRQLHYGVAYLVGETEGEFVFRLDGVEVRVPRLTVPLGL